MENRKSTKRALLLSALSLLMCVSMLIGSTFAWFTDNVAASGNIIKSGNLKISMDWAEGTENPTTANWHDASIGAIFNWDKWEPGFTQVRHIKIANIGTLALKYQVKIVANGYVSELADIIDVYCVDPAVQVSDRSTLTEDMRIGTLTEVLDAVNATHTGNLPADNSNIITLAFKMQETAGNKYQGLSIGSDFSVQLVATQHTFEHDSFNDQYDANAEYPLVTSGAKALGEELVLPYSKTNVQVVVPKEAQESNYSKIVTYENLVENNGKYIYSTDFSVEANGKKVNAVPGVKYQVNLNVGKFIVIDQITHNSVVIPLSECEYDAFTGIVTFYTESFSPFAVTYTKVAENATCEGRKITGGVFTVDPAKNYDISLAAADSDYISIPYTKDGVTYYAVSKRETTIIVAADNAVAFLDGKDETYFNNVLLKNKSGSLYKVISDLQNNDFSTVYILPGTYNEGTTINVYSSMDIIGIGDTDSIKIIKTSSSSSNRHLFNCNGSKADYIEVTLRNLYLDATAKTTNSKDNAAVQSIRKTKVKCYDLTIVKGSGWDAVAFYVNGNNAVDGVKYPAYMYVENCSLNTTRTFGVVTTSGSYKFYHSGLVYNGTAYTNNSGSIKKITMAANDWTWD